MKQMIVDMIVDILTKPIQGEGFSRLRDLLLGTYEGEVVLIINLQ